MKKKNEEDLAKLMKLTSLMKKENIKIAPKGLSKGDNKWRGKEPKFTPKDEKNAEVVDGGGMQVDPARKEEYDNWRQDKLAEQNERIAAKKRKAEASKKKHEQELNPANVLRTVLEQFAIEVGGALRDHTLPGEHASFTVEWFQKNILRGIAVQANEFFQIQSVSAYASTLKRGQKSSRRVPLENISANRLLSDILLEGKQRAQALMEKSFLPETL